MNVEEIVDKLMQSAEVEWSYHEDDHRYPRDFWHIRVKLFDLSDDWVSYGEQEERDLPEDIRIAAEERQLGYLRGALTNALQG